MRTGTVAQAVQRQAFERNRELGRQLTAGAAERAGSFGRLGVGVAPLHDVVVLRAQDRQAVEVALVRQRADVGGVLRGEARRELDHHLAARERANGDQPRGHGVEAASKPASRSRRSAIGR